MYLPFRYLSDLLWVKHSLYCEFPLIKGNFWLLTSLSSLELHRHVGSLYYLHTAAATSSHLLFRWWASRLAHYKVNKDCILISVCCTAVMHAGLLSWLERNEKRHIFLVVSCQLWVGVLQLICRLGYVQKETVLATPPSFMMQFLDADFFFYQCEALYAKRATLKKHWRDEQESLLSSAVLDQFQWMKYYWN